MLVAAAYLHDIGYAPALADEGFHLLDGARFSRSQGQETLPPLVAHHSGARIEAQLRGIDDYLIEFPFGNEPLDGALSRYADESVGESGDPVYVLIRIVPTIAEPWDDQHPEPKFLLDDV